MDAEHTITAKAPDGKMTIGDWREFLAGIPQTADNNNAVPTVRTTFRGAAKSVSVTVKTAAVPGEDGEHGR